MRYISSLIAILVSSVALAGGYDRGPAVQNPQNAYNQYCIDPAVTAEMNFGRICDEMRGVVRVDLFNDDQSAVTVKNHDVNWPEFARGPMTKPYKPLTIDMGQGSQTLDFGDIRWFHYGLPSKEATRIAIRVNGLDSVHYVDGQETMVVEDGMFSSFSTNVTNLSITGLSGEAVKVEVALFWVEGAESNHKIPLQFSCEGNLSAELNSTQCAQWNARLMEYRVYEIGEWTTRTSSMGLK